ncbi:MAG: hypothetical protein KME07_18760 [Pegethrix bostrychoides GSE-TBD4-15B]|jgi:hypothetical protein|uniref:Uncharacterized protein n=1 Tax=Pegethrix bostrychoides GSE-TBD4-15B TaxID=2839662 RepID=A0A951U654_9CYAN|nr:hypothetical protein [Pegethrix bostrychoides GSE-TBD4-15B]
MENWQQDWLKTFETIADDMGQMFEDLGRELVTATDALLDLSEEVAEDVGQSFVQLDQTLAPKLDLLDEQITEWLNPVFQTLLGVQLTFDRAVEPMTHTVEPWLNQHPVCVGCRNYHGQEYNGTPLICAIHPYGVMEGAESCSDKEPIAWAFPNLDQQN